MIYITPAIIKSPTYCTAHREPLTTELLTDSHHDSIIELSVCWCVWNVGEGFPGRFLPNTLKWVALYFSVMFHING